MKLPKWMTITIAAAAVTASAVTVAVAAPAHAASPSSTSVSEQIRADMKILGLSKLPLTDPNLNQHEWANLATVLNAYVAAEGRHLNPDAFVSYFTKTGEFLSVLTNTAYTGPALRTVAINAQALMPDVHRVLGTITVEGDVVAIELHIQGTFEGPLQTPAGVVKPTGAKIYYPTDDFFFLQGGKIQLFRCLIGFSTEMSQMGVNFDWAAAVAGS
jgi:hypothetical protein